MLWGFVLWDFVRRDFVLWDFVLWDSVRRGFVLWDSVRRDFVPDSCGSAIQMIWEPHTFVSFSLLDLTYLLAAMSVVITHHRYDDCAVLQYCVFLGPRL